MFSRIFFAAVGLGAGVALGIWTVRKLERTGRQLTPDALVARAGERAEGFGARLSAAFEEGRRAAAAKEAELRAQYAADGTTTGDVMGGRGGDRGASR